MSNVIPIRANDLKQQSDAEERIAYWRITRLEAQLHELRAMHEHGYWRVREYVVATRELRRLREYLRSDLAASRGWTVASRPFSLRQLLACSNHSTVGDSCEHHYPYIDHAEYFRHSNRPYRPAAILTHAYTDAKSICDFAAEQGVHCEIMPWSWYYPEKCTASLFSHHGGPRAA